MTDNSTIGPIDGQTLPFSSIARLLSDDVEKVRNTDALQRRAPTEGRVAEVTAGDTPYEIYVGTGDEWVSASSGWEVGSSGGISEHGNDAHTETYAVDGDAQPPADHGDDAHTEDYVTIVDAAAEIPTVADAASEPAAGDLSGGELWYNEDTGEYRGYNGDSIGTIGFTADGA